MSVSITINPYTFDIKKYKTKFKDISNYFTASRNIKSLKESIDKINKITKYDSQCSICMERIEDNRYIDSYKCKHFFHAECLNTWMTNQKEKGGDPTCPNCRCEKIRGVLFFPDMYNYRQWRKQYSGTFESVTRPPCEFADIEQIEKLRFKRYVIEKSLYNIVSSITKL